MLKIFDKNKENSIATKEKTPTIAGVFDK